MLWGVLLGVHVIVSIWSVSVHGRQEFGPMSCWGRPQHWLPLVTCSVNDLYGQNFLAQFYGVRRPAWWPEYLLSAIPRQCGPFVLIVHRRAALTAIFYRAAQVFRLTGEGWGGFGQMPYNHVKHLLWHIPLYSVLQPGFSLRDRYWFSSLYRCLFF